MTYKSVFIILLISLLSACTTTEKKAAAVEDRSTGVAGESRATGQDNEAARTYGTGAESATSMTALDDPHSPLSVRIIYFDYDSSEVQSKYRVTVEAHAAFLAANPDVVMSLEGHADERGSREYNLALGERRAQAVKRQMVLLGVPPAQIRTISFGEERPVSEEHDEFAWSQNRRVEIVY